ncbi:ribonuclease HII [Candidatus Gottesmanbacteria bacterium]|nr:ribonuclease HII [Candidatus Gottesmanbacteria bacterium]
MEKRICGIDEAGRGALAGPLVAAAVVLPYSIRKLGRIAKTPIRDGKTLSIAQRTRICRTLKRLDADIHVEVISTRRINNRGIQRANREAIRSLIKRVDADRYIVDGKIRLGRIKGKTEKILTIVNADATIPEVILAGIVAKFKRDAIMQKLHDQLPRYHWKSNAGYGTKLHLQAITSNGATRFHRNVFVTTTLRRVKSRLISAQ